ncbi:MAG: hypothetical protein IH889_03360 [Planctomycetes bacterium]|nr:hypothetical protein [Planctomycetota bacterium]
MSEQRFTNGGNGDAGVLRDERGRFIPGTAGGPGSPHVRKIAKLRSALIQAVSPADLRAIIGKLIEKAKAGDTIAAREVLDRCLGKPVEVDLMERLAELEAAYGVEP